MVVFSQMLYKFKLREKSQVNQINQGGFNSREDGVIFLTFVQIKILKQK